MRSALAALLTLTACGYSHAVSRSPAAGTPATAPSSLSGTLLYPGTDAREASADQGGNVWIATANGVQVLPADGGSAIGYDSDAGLPDDDVRCATGGVPGQALVGFGPQLQSGADQIDLLTLSGGSVSGAPKIFDITGEIVEANHIVYDAPRHQYWIGTNEGVSMLSAAGDAIEHRHPVHPHGATLGLAVTPGGDVWDGDQFQLSKLNSGPQGDFDATFDPVLQPWVQSGQDIAAVLVDGSGDIWAGSLDRGLAQLDPNAFTVQVWTLAAGLPSLSVQSLALDADGTLWVATDTGLGRLNPTSGSWTVFRAPPIVPGSSLPSDDVIDVTIDSSQSPRRVIVTTSQGVVAYDGT
ncbi:MAG TPA: two-component regulator propeller domain-containing protein [Myxococcales bacterium]|nr:two-component regulator propeller domain-containing protein [Myxococcales bacterium]